MHQKQLVYTGINLKEAAKALIMVHGRGSRADDILSLAAHLNVKDFALLAPQATNNTWYPYSFMAPPAQNEPWLSSALSLLQEIVDEVTHAGIAKESIYLLSFSQGACLTLEFVTRNAAKYGGVVAFTGGLIGDKIYAANYKGDFENTPVFIGSSNPDPHVPVERVHATTALLKKMNADVTEKIYNNKGHTITPTEIALANQLIFLNRKN